LPGIVATVGTIVGVTGAYADVIADGTVSLASDRTGGLADLAATFPPPTPAARGRWRGTRRTPRRWLIWCAARPWRQWRRSVPVSTRPARTRRQRLAISLRA
jgi:hypothetical protein